MNKLIANCIFCIACLVARIHGPLTSSDKQSVLEKYSLSQYSEDYNTRYFYSTNLSVHNNDTTLYVKKALPEAFVVEIGPLKKGEKTVFVYDDDKELIVLNENGELRIGGKRIGKVKDNTSKISLYFINGKMIVYIDERMRKEMEFRLDRKRKIGIKLSKEAGITCRYFNCYEPVAFNVADYGMLLEDGIAKTKNNVRFAQHNVGESHNLTFPTDITRQSGRSIRFEHRFDDRSVADVGSMRTVRSEISGVYALSPLNKWIVDFDLLVPSENVDDADNIDIITQIHENSDHPSSPSFCLFMRNGVLNCSIRGDSVPIDKWERKNVPAHRESRELLRLMKDKWYHVKVYLKEGIQAEDYPVTRIWIDNQLLYESSQPNCYTYRTIKGGHYNYLKFGIYKPNWDTKENIQPKITKRVYYFDNYTVKY